MSGLTLNELQAATDGRWLHVELRREQRGDARLGRIAIDSREVRPCDVFWALPGEHRDGLDFVDNAFVRGAAGAVVSSDRLVPPLGRWALAVDDSRQALTNVARYQRERFAGSVIAVTGSVGKTTTRQMIHAVLAARFDGA